jgi:PadR family transcriptional regulator PadR
MSTEDRLVLLQGTLDLLILRTLQLGPAHGHAFAKVIERSSEDVFLVEEGSLYPALHRLIKRGWISFEEGTSENNRKAKFYRLTPKGEKQVSHHSAEPIYVADVHITRPARNNSGDHRVANGDGSDSDVDWA